MGRAKFRQWMGDRFRYWGFVGDGAASSFSSPADNDSESEQYTGLLDCNGVEAYEGDVISTPHFKDAAGRSHTLKHVIVWSDKYHGWFLMNCSSMSEDNGSLQMFVMTRSAKWEVIGNIHQNPELLDSGLQSASS